MNLEQKILDQVAQLNGLLGRIAGALERLADKDEEAPAPAQGGPVVDVPIAKAKA
jgi:hypothetical protein